MKLKLFTLPFLSTRLLFIVGSFLFLPHLLFASSYAITPRVIEHELEPRGSIVEEIKLTNQGSVPVKIFPTVNAITLGIDGKIEEFIAPVMTDQTTNVASWLAISRARIELAPGETIRIPLSVTINPNAKPGEYYAFIGFAEGDKRDEAERIVASGVAPGVTVRIDVTDTTSEYLRLHRFTVDRYVTDINDASVTYELENTGDIPLVPSGEVILYDVRGKEVGAVPLNSDQISLAPSEQKTFTEPLPNTHHFGRHKAFLNLTYGEKQKASLYDTTFFTVVPLYFLVTLLGALLFISAVLTWLYYRRTHHDIDHTDHDDSVPVYVRTGLESNHHDHDVNLKDR